MTLQKLGALSVAATLMVSGASACEITARVNIIGNQSPAFDAVVAGAQECTGAPVTANLTSEHQSLNAPGMSNNPAEYTAAIVANSSIGNLLNDGLIRPLNDLVAEHGQGINPRQFIRVGDDIMAIAFMANAQHLMYRADILEDAGLEVPQSYEEMLDAAEKLRAEGVMQYPIGGAYAAGWNLGQEFVNMYLGLGGSLFEPGTAKTAVNSDKGVQALEMMKALSEYMNPDFLTHDSNATTAEYRAGNVAFMNIWGSRAATQTDVEGIDPVVKAGHAIGGPLTVGDSGDAATTLWWDGWTIAKNISDEEAESAFIALMNGTSPSQMENAETQTLAVWLIDGYEPTPQSAGVFASVEAGARPYPMIPYIGLLHTALGSEISDFMLGNETAEQALADVEAAYTAAAKESGYLQ